LGAAASDIIAQNTQQSRAYQAFRPCRW